MAPVDIYFVSGLGDAAAAGVGAAGSVSFLVSALVSGARQYHAVLISCGARVLLYAIPVIWPLQYPSFRIEHIWHFSIVTIALQAMLCLWFLHIEFAKRLPPARLAGVRPA